ncbi:30S ribosomal protein S21 [candidate division KSB1 bacterium]|nr:30S ribosomal protein S21 [candidate division KSB1 bacterium]
MTHIKIRETESFEKAFRRFKKACEKSGLMREVKKHQRYEKPSERRKRKANMARKKLRRMMMEASSPGPMRMRNENWPRMPTNHRT